MDAPSPLPGAGHISQPWPAQSRPHGCQWVKVGKRAPEGLGQAQAAGGVQRQVRLGGRAPAHLLGLAVNEARVPRHLLQGCWQPLQLSGQLQPAVVGGRQALGGVCRQQPECHRLPPAPTCWNAHLEMLKVLHAEGQTALPAHWHQEGAHQALDPRTSPRATHLDVRLARGDRLALWKARGLGRGGVGQGGSTHLLGAVDGPLALWTVFSIHTVAALGAPVAAPEAAHTSTAPGRAGGC